jgi:GNAT superfamily N-acetyltransferase
VELKLEPVLRYGTGATANLLREGFADYVVPFTLDGKALRAWIQHDGMDLESSVAITLDGKGVGAALIERREQASRLAAMALLPKARGKGVGGLTMDRLMDQARRRGYRSMELEVIEGNEPALRLYRRCGFRRMRRLLSFVAEDPQAKATGCLEPADVADMARLVQAHGLPDLPWQISGQALIRGGPHSQAFRLDNAYIATSDPEATEVHVRSVLVKPQARGQGQARRVLGAMFATYPGRTWHISPLCPEELGGLFEGIGFVPDDLSQLQMRAELS